MGRVIFENSVSLDGFVAGLNDNPNNPLGDGGMQLFKWYNSGDTALHLPGTDMVFNISRASAEFLQKEWATLGAMVAGRRMFDISEAWHGNPPGGENCFIVTHSAPQEWVKPGSPFTFVTDGVESAIQQAQKVAAGRTVSIGSASIMQQALKAGLLDEIQIDLVPVLLGDGVRLFDNLGATPLELECTQVVEGMGVTHLRYRVVK